MGIELIYVGRSLLSDSVNIVLGKEAFLASMDPLFIRIVGYFYKKNIGDFYECISDRNGFTC